MSTFTWLASYPASQPVQPKVLKAQFGDGYEQRVGDGINTLRRTWNVQFNLRLVAEIDEIENFLRARGGSEAFDWIPPRGAAGKWVCEQWSAEVAQPVYQSLSAVFREVFEP